jgi:hypothetical protein
LWIWWPTPMSALTRAGRSYDKGPRRMPEAFKPTRMVRVSGRVDHAGHPSRLGKREIRPTHGKYRTPSAGYSSRSARHLSRSLGRIGITVKTIR